MNKREREYKERELEGLAKDYSISTETICLLVKVESGKVIGAFWNQSQARIFRDKLCKITKEDFNAYAAQVFDITKDAKLYYDNIVHNEIKRLHQEEINLGEEKAEEYNGFFYIQQHKSYDEWYKEAEDNLIKLGLEE